MRYVLIFTIALFLVGCQSSDDTSDTQPVEEAVPTDMPIQVEEEIIAEDDEAIEPTATPFSLERRPLPPTWTPTFEPEPEQVIRPAQTTSDEPDDPFATETPTPVFVPTQSPACQTFSVNIPDNREVMFGNEATVAWQPVDGAMLYGVEFFDEDDVILHRFLTRETFFTFSTAIFDALGLYGWTVEPYDAIGFVMCNPLGDVIFITERFD